MLWQRPPSIADVTSGAWSCFREKSEIAELGRDETYILKLGKSNWEKQVEEGESLWYDQTNCCKLIFELLSPMDEGEWLTTEEEYGRPVPEWPFRVPYENGYSATSQSLWMYS
jgi:hypothetical protein